MNAILHNITKSVFPTSALFLGFALLLGLPRAGAGQGRAPKKSEKAAPSKPAKGRGIKSAANEALNNIDKGVHEAGGAVMDAGNKALNSVDKTIHKALK